MLQDLSANKRDELTGPSLIRAHFDALLDVPKVQTVEDLDLPEEVMQALILKDGELTSIFELVFASEQGKWGIVSTLLQQIKLDEKQISAHYLESI